MVVTNIFSFSYNVFFPFLNEFYFSCHIYILVCKCFQFGYVRNLIEYKRANPCEPITRRQILDSSKLKEFADDNFKFDENDRKLSKWVENTVGKGEIARYEQFLLFPQCFQKACFPGASKGLIVWEWVKPNFRILANTHMYFKGLNRIRCVFVYTK